MVESALGERSRNRRRVMMTATLLTPGGAAKVRIRDISPVGAQVVGVSGLSGSCDALLKRNSLFAAARVVWADGDEAGIQFYRTLKLDELEDIKFPLAMAGKRQTPMSAPETETA